MRAGFILSEVGSGLRKNFSMVLSVVLVTFVYPPRPPEDPSAGVDPARSRR